MYTLAGLDDPDRGWGRRDETWTFMAALAALGGETWFQLGDGDLATHVERTRRLAGGESLSAITADFCRRLGIAAAHPADERRPGAHPAAHGRGLARLPGLFRAAALRARWSPNWPMPARRRRARIPRCSPRCADPRLRAVVICPSNPFISIDPILAVRGMREAMRPAAAPVVAVSPIIGGRAVKGPTAKMMAELGLPVSATAVARHYARPARRLCARRCGCRERGRARHSGDDGAYADADARGSRGAGARSARRRRRAAKADA